MLYYIISHDAIETHAVDAGQFGWLSYVGKLLNLTKGATGSFPNWPPPSVATPHLRDNARGHVKKALQKLNNQVSW